MPKNKESPVCLLCFSVWDKLVLEIRCKGVRLNESWLRDQAKVGFSTRARWCPDDASLTCPLKPGAWNDSTSWWIWCSHWARVTRSLHAAEVLMFHWNQSSSRGTKKKLWLRILSELCTNVLKFCCEDKVRPGLYPADLTHSSHDQRSEVNLSVKIESDWTSTCRPNQEQRVEVRRERAQSPDSSKKESISGFKVRWAV